MSNKKKMTMGMIVGNRGFFPDHLAKTGREEMIRVLQGAGMDVVVLGPEQSKHGAVETYEEAKRCAELFKSKAEAIDGVIITLPNFGEERGIVDALRLARLGVPVLVQATPDTPVKMGITHRRDSFCGKMSVQQPAAVQHPVFADHAAYGKPGFHGIREGPGMVRWGLPHRKGPAKPAHWSHRRAANRVQYRAFQ